MELQECLDSKTSKGNGKLEDQTFNIDARTLALLGKKQQLRVSSYAIVTDIIDCKTKSSCASETSEEFL